MNAVTPKALKPAMARFLFKLRDTQPIAHGMHSVSNGADRRVANEAAGEGYVRMYNETMRGYGRDLPPKPKWVVPRNGDSVELLAAGALALKAHELTLLPDEVTLLAGGVVYHRTKGQLGQLRRTFMKRNYKGDMVRSPKAVYIADGLESEDKIQAARAVCKAAGLGLPGEDY